MLLALNSGIGEQVTQTTPAEVTCDVNDAPLSVLAGTSSTGMLSGGIFSLTEIEAAGLILDDVPNLKIVDAAGELIER